MMVYNVTHPDHPKAILRVSVNAQGQVDKLYATNSDFINIACLALIAPISSPNTILPADAYRVKLQDLGCVVTEEQAELATNAKVALWCRLWQEYKGEKWAIGGPDAKRLGQLKLDERLLRWYLDDKNMPQTAQTWLWRGKQSIANLFHYINQVRVAMSTPAPSKHPDFWSREHLQKLDGQAIGEYHAHLRGLGLVAKHHRDGSILDYIKP